VSAGLIGKRAEIEIASLEFGVQIEARWVPVMGLTYDPYDDSIEILLEGIEHIVSHPREIYVDYGPGGIESLGIVDAARAWQIVVLREPLMLPAPRR
jgi:hypothetical protein